MCLAAFIMWLSNKGRADPLFLIKKIKSWVFAPLFLWKRVKSWVFGYWQVCWLYYGWLWVTANWVLLRVNTDKHWQTPTTVDKFQQHKQHILDFWRALLHDLNWTLYKSVASKGTPSSCSQENAIFKSKCQYPISNKPSTLNARVGLNSEAKLKQAPKHGSKHGLNKFETQKHVSSKKAWQVWSYMLNCLMCQGKMLNNESKKPENMKCERAART